MVGLIARRVFILTPPAQVFVRLRDLPEWRIFGNHYLERDPQQRHQENCRVAASSFLHRAAWCLHRSTSL